MFGPANEKYYDDPADAEEEEGLEGEEEEEEEAHLAKLDFENPDINEGADPYERTCVVCDDLALPYEDLCVSCLKLEVEFGDDHGRD